jgi:DNA modification methylase
MSKSQDKQELFDESGNSRGFYSKLNRLNDLTGKEWLFWTRSVISKVYPPNLQHKLRSAHGGQKPPELCRDLIKIFTKKGQRVLDPFMGVGGVLLGAALSNRSATGIEMNGKWIEIYKQVCEREGLKQMEVIEGDAKNKLSRCKKSGFDLILTDVPYWKMDRAPRSTGKYKKHGEQSRQAKLSKLSAFNRITYGSKDEWLKQMSIVFKKASACLKEKGYLLSFIGDMYYNDEYHCLSYELASILVKIKGLVWKANLIWYDVSKKLHLYGYQYAFIPSMIHQNILVFRKQLSTSV